MNFDSEGDTATTVAANSRQMVFDLSGSRCYRLGGRLIMEIPDATVLEMANQPASSLAGPTARTEIMDQEKFLDAVLQEFRGTEIETGRGRFESRMGAAVRGAIRALADKGDTAAWRREPL